MSQLTVAAFEDFFSRSPLACSLCNMQGAFLQVNQAFADLVGYSIPELLQTSYWHLIPKEFGEQEEDKLQQLSERGTSDALKVTFLHREHFLVSIHVSSWVAESDGEKFILSVAEPVDYEQARIARSPQAGRATRDRSGDSEWSEAKNACRCELIDRKIQDIISIDEAAELDDLQEAMRAHLDKVVPLPMDGAKRLHADLMRRKAGSVPQDISV